jgi:two-component system cell cycle sensor histidine kinase/response regulator CckA
VPTPFVKSLLEKLTGNTGSGGDIGAWLTKSPAPWSVGAGVLTAAAALVYGLQPGHIAAVIALAMLATVSLAGLFWSVFRSRPLNPTAEILLAAAEANPDARLITKQDGSFVYANASFHRLFSMANSLDAIAATLSDGDASFESFKRLRSAAISGVPGEATFLLHVPSVGREWRRVSVSPVPGHLGLALWRASDITATHELAIVQRQEEERFADFLDELPAGFFSADANGRIQYANRTTTRWLTGDTDSRALIGHKFGDFVVETEIPDTTSFESDKDSPSHGDVTLRRIDGSTFKVSLIQSERIGPDGEMIYSRSLMLRDVAWRSDHQWVQAEQRLHWLFDEAPVGILVLDLSGTVTECNKAFLSLLGVHREAVIGRPFADRLSREDRNEVAGQLSKIVMGVSRAAHHEVRMPGASQQDVITSLFASRIEDANGDVDGLILHFIDTTDQKNLEVQFAQSQKMQAVGQLAGGVAHDFNNLLTAMIGFTDLLLERHGEEDSSHADIMQIRQNAERATNLVRQLLAFSRKQTLEPEILALTEVINELTSLLGRLLGEQVELELDHGDDLGLVRADRGQFEQVIVNLAVNARDAMPGGGTLTMSTKNILIREPVQRGIEVIPAGDYILVEVSDTGAGIARENIGHIFEPFFSTKDVGAGTGLGLSTVFGIVKQTGGYITVDSAPGEGTTFTIYLPRYDDGSARSADTPPAGDLFSPETRVSARSTPSNGKTNTPNAPVLRVRTKTDTKTDTADKDLSGAGTILLVEDEDAVRMFGTRALTNKGYTVLEANNGESALDVINGTDAIIDLIISDVVMPGMDGNTLVQLIRHELPDMKVILMSGYAEDVLTDDNTLSPDIHFLPKPFTLSDLAALVKDVLAE